MIVLTRMKLLLLAAVLLAVLAGGVLAGTLYRDSLVAWLGLSDPAAMAAEQHAGRAPSTKKAGGEREILYWYDPMHPSYQSDQPGIAPDCGMELVPRYADEMEALQTMPPGTVQLSPAKQQLIGVRTAQVERQPLTRTIRTVGRLEVDETRIARVHVKVAGWVEKVYVDFVGKVVQRGEPLFTLYSPELVSTQKEYLIARRGQQYLGDSPYREAAQSAESLLRASRERLRLWDISDDQIQRLEESGQVTRTMTLYSPIRGVVLHRNLYEQAYVTPDRDLYEIADLSTIWVYVDIYEYEVPYVRLGQSATMRLSYQPGKTYRGRVTYIYPTLDPKSRTVKVRLEFPNPNLELKPDMFADVELKVHYGVQTVVPSEAVLDSGLRQVVFVARPGGYFEPRQVEVGSRLDDRYVILSGLQPGETIVTSGNFLIDSESRLGAAIGDMEH